MFETEDTSCQRHQDASGKVRLFWGKNEPQTSSGSMLAGAETIHPLLQFSIVYFLYEDLNHWLYFKNSLYLNTSHLVTLFFVIFAANWLFYKFKMDYVIYKRPPQPCTRGEPVSRLSNHPRRLPSDEPFGAEVLFTAAELGHPLFVRHWASSEAGILADVCLRSRPVSIHLDRAAQGDYANIVRCGAAPRQLVRKAPCWFLR